MSTIQRLFLLEAILAFAFTEGFSLRPRKSVPTALFQFSGSSNYLDNLNQYSNYQQEQRQIQEENGQYLDNNQYYFDEPQQQTSYYEEQQQPQELATTQDGMMNWSPEATRLPVGEDQNMNVEQDFTHYYNYDVTGQPPVEKVLEEDFDRYLQMVSTEVAVKRLNGENTFAITDVPADVILNGWLDSMEDALLKLRRYEKGRPFKADRPTIVVLGSGWAAHSFVKLASTYDLKIIVVSPVNHFVSLQHKWFLSFLLFNAWTHIFGRSLLPCWPQQQLEPLNIEA